MSIPTSELLWEEGDYTATGQEPPSRLVGTKRCEGEIMTDAEVESFLTDGIMTLKIMSDQDSSKLEHTMAAFKNDLQALLTLGRISSDDYNELMTTELDNLSLSS